MRARSARRAAAVLAGTVAVLAPAPPAGALAAPAVSADEPPVFRDRVFKGVIARGAQLRSASPETGYTAPDGQVVRVSVSSSVPNGPAVAQQTVDFLGSRLHGLELGRLRVFIGTPEEVRSICGGDPRVLACYAAGERRMFVPDRDPRAGNQAGFTRDHAITHEYGHHIAAFRSNSPWPALDWGAKYWASYEFVCAGVEQGRFFPGNQGEHYLDDPGEAFAHAYAKLHYPDLEWQYNPLLEPDAGAFAAIRRDVLTPWQGSQRRLLRGSLGGGRVARATSFVASLDGRLDLRLAGPRRANYDIAVYDGRRRLVQRTRTRGSRDRLRVTICRRPSSRSIDVLARVIRRTGAGRFTLTTLFPG